MTKEERLIYLAEHFFLGDTEFYCNAEVEDIRRVNQEYIDSEEH